MGSKNCLNHPNAPALAMCHGCHKPICQSCTMITPMGKFCSSECSVRYRETKQVLKEGEKKGGAGKAVVLLLLLVVLVLGLAHVFRDKYEILQKIDVIGNYLLK